MDSSIQTVCDDGLRALTKVYFFARMLNFVGIAMDICPFIGYTQFRRAVMSLLFRYDGVSRRSDAKGVCLMGRKITEKVTWVGKIDWELNKFHGHEYSTEKVRLIIRI